ncbi:hypothetical protein YASMINEVIRUS_1356 [Yasminevirus sp. GU-2018]|uniref:Endonuclease/exonuclease/phosphatase domain-containing protein n=1 Tax=Yasminevirus sp. GU-2018 TaxID=2420051 RepID=A0A5K0UBD8_9VIRU|nr:hypothetical protein YASMINEVIRUS_1356 [Yasminevirus sp. GU-2018]
MDYSSSFQKKHNSRHDSRHDVRVITFNLLSQETINDVYFPLVKKHYSEFDGRSVKMKKLLESWMKVNFIICLQEMSVQWQKVLQPFFAENNYGFESQTYANGKMGVGIAYPFNHYDLLKKDEYVCGTGVKPILHALKRVDKKFKPHVSHASKKGYHEGVEIDMKPIIDELSDATDAKNVLLSLLLHCKFKGSSTGKNLIVSTYHMPCRFMLKYYLVSHILALKTRLSELSDAWSQQFGDQTVNQSANSTPTILAGDFNISAKSPEYKFLTGEAYTENEILTQKAECGESIEFVRNSDLLYNATGFDVNSGMKLRSVHKTLHGKEPPYTNVSLKADFTFVECIDYILISDDVDIRSCTVGLTVDNPHGTPYPNGLCPSDHLPLSASLSI